MHSRHRSRSPIVSSNRDRSNNSSFAHPNRSFKSHRDDSFKSHRGNQSSSYKHVSTPRPKLEADNSRFSLNHYGYRSRESSFRTPSSSSYKTSHNFKTPYSRASNYERSEYKRDSLYTPDAKPIMNLLDPSSVPRSRVYFEHDARDNYDNYTPSSTTSNRHLYDPRNEPSSRYNTPLRYGNSSERNYRNFTPKSNNNQFYDSPSPNFGHNNNYNNNNFNKRNSFREQRRNTPTKNLNEPWEHDKFEELINEEKSSANENNNPFKEKNNKRMIVEKLEEHLSEDEIEPKPE